MLPSTACGAPMPATMVCRTVPTTRSSGIGRSGSRAASSRLVTMSVSGSPGSRRRSSTILRAMPYNSSLAALIRGLSMSWMAKLYSTPMRRISSTRSTGRSRKSAKHCAANGSANSAE
ncbi:hypothetical protein ABZ801_35745 [Actinomadura sp. NPDC047616]|uniref:hypothetical protein n=1 Tax=Actinomadura sp. NPDC047616 TaxID=3155914 RepID=UPI0033EF04B8